MSSPPLSPGQFAIALAPGTAITERYRVVHVLGTPGGFGITYLAQDGVLERLVAVKEFLPRAHATRAHDRTTVEPHSHADEPHFRNGLTRFLDEGRRLAKVRHPNVVGVQDFCEAHGTAYLVMDYYSGCTLAELLIERGGRLAVDDAVRITNAVLQGLAATHAANIWHRDVKPSNIYITTEGTPILLDFGAARQGSADSLTSILTHGFAPIEQYGSHGQGPWTDVYAAAAVLYVMLTGEQPSPATARAFAEEDPLAPPHKVATYVSERLSLAVLKGMAVQPHQRPQTATEFDTILRQALAGAVQVKPGVHAAASTRGYVADAWKTRATAVTAAALVIAIAALGVWKLGARTTPAIDSGSARPAPVQGSVSPSNQLRDSVSPTTSVAGAGPTQAPDDRARRDSANRARAALRIARQDSIRRAQDDAARARQAAVPAVRDSDVTVRAEVPPKPVASDARTSAALRTAAESRLQKETELIAQSIQRGSVEGFDEQLVRFVRSKKNLEAGVPTLSDTRIADTTASAAVKIPLSWKSDFGPTRKDVLELRIGLRLVGAAWQRATLTSIHIP